MILFKPVNGTLDINTAAPDLQEQADGTNIASGAMVRCKNLRLDRPGVLVTRDGSSKVNPSTPLTTIVDLLIEQGGVRYEFLADNLIWRNETLISEGIQVDTPVITPVAGVYTVAQTVTVTCGTLGAIIYYTLDGTTPSITNGLRYSVPVTLPVVCYFQAIAVKTGYIDSTVVSGFYSVTDLQIITEINSNSIITETDSKNIINEGV
jgi:hypothetical protein